MTPFIYKNGLAFQTEPNKFKPNTFVFGLPNGTFGFWTSTVFRESLEFTSTCSKFQRFSEI